MVLHSSFFPIFAHKIIIKTFVQMKYYHFLAIAALAVASCNGPKESTPQVQTKQESPAVSIDTIAFTAPEYLSPDLAMQELGGRVKSMEYTAYECDNNGQMLPEAVRDWAYIFQYDQNGKYTKAYAMSPTDKGAQVTRDEKGFAVETTRMIANAEATNYVHKYTFTQVGNIATQEDSGDGYSGKTQYSYTDDVLKSSVVDEKGDNMVYHSENTFAVIAVDAHGNWTKRFCTTLFQSGPDDGSGKYTDSETIYSIEERKIVYY